MDLTSAFFMIALIITGIFVMITLILFICYLVIFFRVNKNFGKVKK
ncbi:hypothetical protein [Liquorilactobacillus sicerae]|nr:hypothetical protein [Liquorilactobacillus sicerae]